MSLGTSPESGSARSRLLLVAGEASGDLHGASLARELRELRPGIELVGVGGDRMEGQGVELLYHYRNLAVVGITEVLAHLGDIRRAMRRLVGVARSQPLDGVVLVDYPDFNLALARRLRKVRPKLPIVYYISPQVWAWRRGRVADVAERVDEMLVLFPFEEEFYRRHGVRVTWVGHPLVDEVPELEGAWDRGAPAAGEPYRLALLPGSRRSEVAALLPAMLGAAQRLAERVPLRVRLIRAPSLPRELLEEPLAGCGLDVRVVESGRFDAVADCHLALCASGTATLEVGLLRTPMIVLYRLAGWTWLLARLLVRVPHASLVNLVLERGAVPELLQSRAEPEAVAAEAEAILTDPERVAAMRRDLGALRARLGEAGATARAADRVAARLAPGSAGARPAEAAAAAGGPGRFGPEAGR
jgi:lipid-A-disaccharide synthase